MPSVKRSYKAEGSIRELRISVCQYPERTRLAVSWSTRERGDEPLQGHLWSFSEEYTKPIRSLLHALSLAGWLARKATSQDMRQIR
jgi:hypothetical protein